MKTQHHPGTHSEKPAPKIIPEIIPPADPEEPLNIPEEDPDIVPEEDPFETPPPYEIPGPGEGP